jgi:hypothetical protein
MYEPFKTMQHLDTKETYEVRKEANKEMHMLQLARHGKGMETKKDIKEWEEKFEKTYPPYKETNN